ncbi:amidohydrolase family protein [Cryptosporangium minutisporangium]|uniref:Amidohydrolase-related domain-containing protein n=1 Tax=Cryptosporangium minutisporangium TaxID=113569 RepID=A0ABP6SS05_9ACTN
MTDLEIVDCHNHVLRSADHSCDLYSNLLRFSAAMGLPDRPEFFGTPEEAERVMDATGIAHMNILMFTWSGVYWRQGQNILPDESRARAAASEDLRQRIVRRIQDNNTWALEQVAGNPRLSCFVGIDPVLMDSETLLAEVENGLRRGALGVKHVPMNHSTEGDDPRLRPVLDYCASAGVPILTQAAGFMAGRPGRWAKPLADFPTLKLIFAHLGHDRTFGQGADAEVLELVRAYPNVHTDVSLRLIEVAEGHVSAEDMVAHLRKLGSDRVLFGSNWVISEYLWMRSRPGVAHPGSHDRLDREIEVLKTLPLTDDERTALAAGNFRRLTGLGR